MEAKKASWMPARTYTRQKKKKAPISYTEPISGSRPPGVGAGGEMESLQVGVS